MKDYSHPDNAYLSKEDDPFIWGVSNASFKIRKMTQNRKNKLGLVKIEIEVEMYFYGGKGSYNRKRLYVDTRIWVNPKHWNNKTQKLSQEEDNYQYKINIINQTFAATQAYIASKGQQSIDRVYIEGVDFSKVREIFPNRKENRKTFYDYMVKYKEHRKTDGQTAENTVKVINTISNRIKSFDNYRERKTYIEDVNFSWSDEFNMWCVNVKQYKEQTIDRTYQVIIGALKYYWKRKEELQLNISDAFKDTGFSYGKKSSNKPHALTLEQREITFNHRFKQQYLEKARKMMCLQLYTGCRFSDIARFNKECFKKKGKLIFKPKKTFRYDIEVEQPLHPNAEELFQEVDYDTTKIYDTSSQKYGDYLKKVITELRQVYPDAEFDDDYSSHNMRDSFISICVKRGVNFKSLLKWVGQKKYETLSVYIDLDDEFEKSEMDKTLIST